MRTPGQTALPGLYEGLVTTRAIRRYLAAPVPLEDLSKILFAASRAPSGSNRQGFRFIVLRREDDRATAARRLLGEAARGMWATKRSADNYDAGSGVDSSSPKARLAHVMDRYVERFEDAPVIVVVAMVRHRPGPEETIGASVYPAAQNLLLAARSLGYGGVMTTWHALCEPALRAELEVPDDVFLAATVTLGTPAGSHGPVRRRPLGELVHDGRWGSPAAWVSEPPETRHTSAGPPRSRP